MRSRLRRHAAVTLRRTTTVIPVVVFATLFAASPAAAQAPPPDYSGTWSVFVTAELPNNGGTCTFDAQAEVQQDGSLLAGTLSLVLIEGPQLCPNEAMGVVTADVAGDGCLESGVFDGGQMFGLGSFDGCPTGPQGQLTGPFALEQGPFSGTTGSWIVGTKQPGIPTASTAGVAALGLLLLVSGIWILRSRSIG